MDQGKRDSQRESSQAFVFIALISIVLTIFVSIMHEIYLYLNK
jgi:hypothetical protein